MNNQQAIDKLVEELMSFGLWSKLKSVYPIGNIDIKTKKNLRRYKIKKIFTQ
jgi:hypothetical protein